MLAWVVDHAHLIYFLLGVAVVGLLVSWWLNRRVRTLFYILVVASLIALFWLLTLIVPTDRRQIEASLRAMAQAVLDRKPDDLAKHWSKDFRYLEMSREEVANVAAQVSRKHGVDDVRVWDFDWKNASDDKAEVWFRCLANAKGGAPFLRICRATFQKENDQWKLHRVAFFQPIANTDEETPLPIR
jgi:hypothetical protein